MLAPLIRRPRRTGEPRSRERGFTMALVAVALVSIIAMAALSIDIGTFYEAKAEAQRSADAAALAAARVISISGITGDPNNISPSWSTVCGSSTSLANLTAVKVAQQNLIAGVAIPSSSVTVSYGAGTAGGSSASCVGVANFGVNPIITVTVKRTSLPIFFGRIFSLVGGTVSSTSVSGTASAEVYNSSASGTVGPGMIPVNPRCVKPWIIPNNDPGNSPNPFVSTADGSIQNQGVFQIAGKGVIGESFNINADCAPNTTTNNCQFPLYPAGFIYDNPPTWNSANRPNALEYIPAFIQANAGAAPSCSAANAFSKAIVGCDQSTVYACGTLTGAQADLTENPVTPTALAGDTGSAVQCLINSATGGQDVLNTGNFPFEIEAGFSSPLVQKTIVNNFDVVTTSNSIVTLPIFDSAVPLIPAPQPTVTIVGFLQVFINNVDVNGNI
ncbi:MAG: pilus assembly protein TadG-related protein, partial [Candidatus Sulfotelmatobacter sp.]